MTSKTLPKNTDAKAGGSRFSEGKPGGWWYAPIYGLRLVAGIWEQGSKKYAPMDWKEGQSFSSLMDCAFRHTLEVMERGPWARCPDSGELHVGHIVWNWLTMLTFMAKGDRPDLNDVDKWRGITAAAKHEMAEEERDGF